MEDQREPAPLSRLGGEADPSPHLKERVVDTLASRGLVRTHSTARWAWAVAAGIALFAAGVGLGRRTGARVPESQRYALLLYDPAGFDHSVPEENLVEEYRQWAISLGNKLSMGEKLSREERLLQPD